MKFLTLIIAGAALLSSVTAHPSKLNLEERDSHDLQGRGSSKCAAQSACQLDIHHATTYREYLLI